MSAETELVRRAVAGEQAAFAGLYDRYSRPVFLTLVGMLRLREDAEDALQATFLSAWNRLGTLRRPDRFVSWLFRIARNQARDALRARRNRPPIAALAEDAIAPSGPAAGREEIESLLAALQPEARALVLLRAVYGWSTEEVARALGKSPATIRRRYARALERLRTGTLKGVGHAAGD